MRNMILSKKKKKVYIPFHKWLQLHIFYPLMQLGIESHLQVKETNRYFNLSIKNHKFFFWVHQDRKRKTPRMPRNRPWQSLPRGIKSN